MLWVSKWLCTKLKEARRKKKSLGVTKSSELLLEIRISAVSVPEVAVDEEILHH